MRNIINVYTLTIYIFFVYNMPILLQKNMHKIISGHGFVDTYIFIYRKHMRGNINGHYRVTYNHHLFNICT